LERRHEEDVLPSCVERYLYADILLHLDRVGEHLLVVKETGRETFGRLGESRVDTESLKIHGQLAY